MQGASLTQLLRGNTPADWRKTFYYHYYENPGGHNVARHYGVTDGTNKLIHFYALEEQTIDDWELFDLSKDPNELVSVYGDSGYAKIQESLSQELQRLREHYHVPDDPDPRRGARRKK